MSRLAMRFTDVSLTTARIGEILGQIRAEMGGTPVIAMECDRTGTLLARLGPDGEGSRFSWLRRRTPLVARAASTSAAYR